MLREQAHNKLRIFSALKPFEPHSHHSVTLHLTQGLELVHMRTSVVSGPDTSYPKMARILVNLGRFHNLTVSLFHLYGTYSMAFITYIIWA